MVLQAGSVAKKMELRRNMLLHQIRRAGPIGRIELCRQLHMSKSRVCEVVQEMLDEHLIVEELKGNERRGRQPVLVRANPDCGQMVGLDFEAKRMRLVVVDFAGNVLDRRQERLRPMKDRQTFVRRILGFVDEGLEAIRSGGAKALGIGVAAPGIIDRKAGVLVHYDLIGAARHIPFRDLVANHTGLPCVVDNNIRCYALTEWASGAAQHMSDFICLAVRSGVGAAIVRDGRLVDGSHGFSGEAGYIPIPNGKAASQWKTFQETVSEQALGIDVESKVFSLSEDQAKRAGEFVGAQAAALATLLDPEAIVLAGELIQPDGPLWPSLERTYRRFILPDIAERVHLLPSRVGPFAAAIGATHRCVQTLYPTELPSAR
jgi:predicted NBD/HSP70 family sugar kinase